LFREEGDKMEARYIIFDVDDNADVKEGWEIRTDFLNHCNDCISIYAKNTHDNAVELSDGGETLNEVEMSGLDSHDPQLRKYLDLELRCAPVIMELKGDEIIIVVADGHDRTKSSLAFSAMLKVIISINAWIHVKRMTQVL